MEENMRIMWRKTQEMISVNNIHRYAGWHCADETAKQLANLSTPLNNLPDME